MKKKNYLLYDPEKNRKNILNNFGIDEEKNKLFLILDYFEGQRDKNQKPMVSSPIKSTENNCFDPIENYENTIEQAEFLNIPNIELNLFFEPDENSLASLEKYYQKIRNKFGDIVFERKEENLPFHFTIIGNGRISENMLQDFEAKKGVLRDSLLKLKMYNSEKRIPKVKSHQLSWSANPIGRERSRMLRLKFDIGDYILSGDWDVNKEIAEILGNPDMDFSLPSHITLFKFLVPENYHLSFDELQREFKKIYEEFQIKKIMLTPKIMIKRPGEIFHSKLDFSAF